MSITKAYAEAGQQIDKYGENQLGGSAAFPGAVAAAPVWPSVPAIGIAERDVEAAFSLLRKVLETQLSDPGLVDRRLAGFGLGFAVGERIHGLDAAVAFIIDSAGLLELE